MALLEPELAILDETDSGLDIDALKTVAAGVNAAKNDENGIILITHYQARAPAPSPARPSAPCAPAPPPRAAPPMQPATCAPATRGSGCSTSSSASPAPSPHLTPHP
jgi:hypothetical protein